MSGDILNAGVNVEELEYYGFTGSFFQKSPIIIYENNKDKLTKMNSTPMLNIYEQQLKNPICEIIDEKNDKKDNLEYFKDRNQQAR